MKPFQWLKNTVSGIGAFLLFVSTLLAAFNAIARYTINFSSSWADEICVYGLVVAVFLTQCKLEADDDQLSIAVLDPYLNKFGKDILFWIRAIVTIGIWITLVVVGWDVIILNYELNMVTSLMMFPMWIIFTAYTVGMALILVAWVWRIYNKVLGRHS